jgi:excisionase family DNA binding protein
MSSNITVSRACAHCSTPFAARTTATLYCSKSCGRKFNKQKIMSKKIDVSNKETIAQINFSLERVKLKEYLSIADTTILLGVSRSTLYRVLQSNDIAITKVGGRTIVRRTDINLFFNQNHKI